MNHTPYDLTLIFKKTEAHMFCISAGSGYLGSASQASPHSTGSPISASGPYPFTTGQTTVPAINRRESQVSSYERQG